MIEPFTVPFMGRALAEIALLALICGPISVFVFVRRLSFVSDALTHTVFPGVVIGFVAGGLEGLVVGALVEQALVHLLRRYANLRRSAHLELSRAGLVDRRIRLAVELMHAHMHRDLALEEIAASAHLSPFHFARLFKKLTGATPHAYLASLRAARAQALLAETDLPVTEVGARVGYMSSSHFARAFRQATGISPRAYRQALVRG